jgi:hypothetical protein
MILVRTNHPYLKVGCHSAEPYDASLMDSSSIHGSLIQNRRRNTRKVMENGLILMIADDFNFS